MFFVIRNLNKTAAFWGELVPLVFGCVEGGLRLVVRVVTVVFDELFLVFANCIVSAYMRLLIWT